MDAKIVIGADQVEVAREAAGRFVQAAVDAIESRGRFSVALSGGSTPEILYRLLAQEPYREQIPWPQVHLFWGDERCVPPGDKSSNYGLAYETLIRHVSILEENVHRVRGELDPAEAARAYERELEDYFCGPRARFDLVLLGLGSDGHVASLFPGSAVLQETARLATAVEADYENRPVQRVTLTLSAINSARQVLFLVTGIGKAEIVYAVLEEPEQQLPAQRVQPVAGELVWLLDAAAASKLT